MVINHDSECKTMSRSNESVVNRYIFESSKSEGLNKEFFLKLTTNNVFEFRFERSIPKKYRNLIALFHFLDSKFNFSKTDFEMTALFVVLDNEKVGDGEKSQCESFHEYFDFKVEFDGIEGRIHITKDEFNKKKDEIFNKINELREIERKVIDNKKNKVDKGDVTNQNHQPDIKENNVVDSKNVNDVKDTKISEINKQINDAKKLKFQLNFLKKCISWIVEYILVLFHRRAKQTQESYMGKHEIRDFTGLKMAKNNSKTWADQMKFDKAVDIVAETKEQEIDNLGKS